jgi:Tfp pilus assembly protein PilP
MRLGDQPKMMHRLSILAFVVAAVVLPGFSQQQNQQQNQQNQQNPQATAQVEPPPVLAVPAGYRYEPRGRRDPFVNPIPKPIEAEPAPPPVMRPPGLKGVLVAEAKLQGVVSSREFSMTKVIILAPGNKTYFAAKGDYLFDAVIKDIQPDAVVFTLLPKPNAPQPTIRELVRKVRPTTGENK